MRYKQLNRHIQQCWVLYFTVPPFCHEAGQEQLYAPEHTMLRNTFAPPITRECSSLTPWLNLLLLGFLQSHPSHYSSFCKPWGVWSGGSCTCGVCAHNTETTSANLRESLRCAKDQHSILVNEPHNLAGLPPTSISISSINRRQNNSNFLYIMQPLIVPDQVLAPRGYSFCSVGNHA